MFNESILDDETFWDIVQYIDNINGDVDIKEMSISLNSSPEVISTAVLLLKSIGYELSIENGKLLPPPQKERITLDLSLTEWLSFQAHFPVMTTMHGKCFHKYISEKLATIEKQYPDLDLFRLIDFDNAIQDAKQEENSNKILNTVETAINGKLILGCHVEKQQHSIEVLPHRLLYLDKKLTIIAEDTNDKNLINMDLNSLLSAVIKNDNPYRPNYSHNAVNDFIQELRQMGRGEDRLILKIKEGANINLNPNYHYFVNPYITTNSNGIQIWAGTVEKSIHLYEWLHSINDKITILGPENIKNELDDYIMSGAFKKKAS